MPEYMEHHKCGWPIVERIDANVIVKRENDYAVGHLYDPYIGVWAWGHYGYDFDEAHKLLLKLCLEDINNGR